MNKQARQIKIRELLEKQVVEHQNDLILLLRESGMSVAQATLSRDCAELGIIRTRINGKYRMVVPDDNAGRLIKGLVEMEIVAVHANETTVLLRTLPGRAHGVGSYLDQLRSPLILGTIAGDDTVLVIPSSVQNIATLITYIHNNLSTTK